MPQRVDPFLPLPPSSNYRPQTTNGVLREQPPHAQSVNGANPQHQRLLADRPHHHTQTVPQQQTAQTAGRPNTVKRSIFSKIQAPVVLLVAIGFGLLIQSLAIGELFIILYAIFAFARRVSSRTTFLLALFSLFCIVLLLILRSNNQLASNFAVYTFLLLAIGTVALGREVRATDV